MNAEVNEEPTTQDEVVAEEQSSEDKTEVVQAHDSVLKTFTDEQFEEVKTKASELVKTIPEINLAAGVLYTTRQLYACARYSLSREMEKLGITWDSGVEEFIIQAFINKGMQPFERSDLMERVKSMLLPYMVNELEYERKAELEESAKQLMAEESERADTPVPIGLDKWPSMDRKTPLLVTGTFDFVDEQLEQVMSNLGEEEEPFNILTLSTTPGQQLFVSPTNPNHVIVPFGWWQGISNSPAKMHDKFRAFLRLLPKYRCDVVLIDKGQMCHTKGLIGGRVSTKIEQAVKPLRKVCEELKAALVVGIPVDDIEEIDEINSRLSQYYGVLFECTGVKSDAEA